MRDLVTISERVNGKVEANTAHGLWVKVYARRLQQDLRLSVSVRYMGTEAHKSLPENPSLACLRKSR